MTQFSRDVIVRKGDTLYSISRKYDVPVRDIIDENGLRAPYALKIGQKIRLPYSRTHTVRYSETLYSISRKYGMSVATLARQNNIRPPYALRVGQVLKIAGTERATATDEADTPQQQGARADKKASGTRAVKSGSSFKKPAYVPRSQAGKTFAWPVRGKIVSDYGNKGYGQHNDGINIAGKKGASIKAADAGVVAYAGSELKGYGNLLLLRHSDGWITAYAHNDKLLVKKGQRIVQGQQIATMGQTGSAKTPQLHFEVRYKSKVVNPKIYLR